MCLVYKFQNFVEIRHSLKFRDFLVLVEVEHGGQVLIGKSLENRQIYHMGQM